MAELKYDVVKTLGVLSEGSKGWKKELNLVSWNDKEAKYDIRDWDESHSKMGKGVTLTEDDLRQLRLILNEMAL